MKCKTAKGKLVTCIKCRGITIWDKVLNRYRCTRCDSIFSIDEYKHNSVCAYVSTKVVIDDNGQKISPLDDDYGYYKQRQEDLSNPLSDDYCKYDNE